MPVLLAVVNVGITAELDAVPAFTIVKTLRKN
jgi:hypothetical protein